jgi:hypothetical protein
VQSKKILGLALFLFWRASHDKNLLFNVSHINNLLLGGALTLQSFCHHHLSSPSPCPKKIDYPILGV